jgi:hypothetical protein
LGETPPEFAKSHVDPTGYMRWWQALNPTDRAYVEQLIGAPLRIS